MNCVVQGIEIEKTDPEFKNNLINPPKIKIECAIPEKNLNGLKAEIIVNTDEKITGLTPTQNILYNFISEQLSRGESIKEIEDILHSKVSEGLYTYEDVFIAVNYSINSAFSDSIKIPESKREKTPKENFSEYPFLVSLNKEEKNFMVYLIKNPCHENSTVELYNLVGLSTRKGNVIKNQLMNKGLITIEEEKNEKGWKKLIRISKSYSQN